MSDKNETTEKIQKRIILTLILGIIAIGLIGFYAFSKYITSVEGTGEAQVARWSFKVNEQSQTFETIDLTKTLNYNNIADERIAPGTKGSFELRLDGSESEVAIDYTITMNFTNKPKNLILYRDNTYKNPVDVSADGNTGTITGFIMLDTDKTKQKQTETIYWEWPYETPDKTELAPGEKTNDEQDTIDSGKDMTIGVTVTGTQRTTNPTGVEQGATVLVSPEGGEYKAGQKIEIQVIYSENVYADNQKTAIDENNAPTMKIRFGTGDAKDATFKAVSGRIITYTYEVAQNDNGALYIASYKGNVYNEKGASLNVETKDIVGKNITTKNYPFLANVVQVGDYVNYDATSGEGAERSYPAKATDTGAENDVTFNSNEITKWRVLHKDSATGSVELVAADSTSTNLILNKGTGFVNAENVLNAIGDIYGHGKGAIKGRSIKIEDIEKYSSFNKTAYKVQVRSYRVA